VYDTRRPRLLKARLARLGAEPVSVKAEQPYTLRVSVHNVGDTIWLAKRATVGGFVTVGARLHDAARQPVEMEYGRAFLSENVNPDDSQVVDITLVAPEHRGVYHVELDMVCETMCWFSQRGSDSLWERITVL